MNSYRLTQRAADDIIEVEFHSIAQFGHRQAERYKHSLQACFELLAGQPRMGRLARNIGVGVRRHEHASHVILYETDAEGILVLAVVHAQNMQISNSKAGIPFTLTNPGTHALFARNFGPAFMHGAVCNAPDQT